MKRRPTKERKELFCGTLEECHAWQSAQEGGDGMEIVRYTERGPFSVFHKRREIDRTIKTPIRRLTRERFKVQGVSKEPMRPLWVALEPGDVISFTPKGTSQKIMIPIAHAYNAARFSVARAAAQAKRTARKAKR